jgi:diketogulonate reductase-like aldo/keto reductase
MFEVDKNIVLDKTKIWGSAIWFDAMKNRYPNWTTTTEELYFIRKHPGRITETKRNMEKLIKKGIITEAEIINLNFEQLQEILKKYKGELN